MTFFRRPFGLLMLT